MDTLSKNNPANNAASITEKVEGIERKLQKLVKEYRSLREENRELVEERRQLKATVDKQREDLKHFQNQIKSSIVVSTIAAGDGEAGALRNKIDEYVKEIERCIAHMSEA
jgi:uncharacterized protein YlxW (UPF0749 family)